jgi:hypothetical protein
MANRSTGWIQDPGRLENLIKVVELFDHNSQTHHDLLTNLIPQKVLPQDGRQDFISELNSRRGHRNYPKIRYKSLVGTAFTPRSSARCNGIIQALISGQRRSFISDWPANNFIRWAETLGFIQYYQQDDIYSITDFGLKLTQSNTLNSKFDVLKESFLQYPPVTRILELLYTQYNTNPTNPLLTKFELGRELGFRGEDGFTTYPQHLVVEAIVMNPMQKNQILTDWEGSSDKYARMICGWLAHRQINWVEQSAKAASANIGGQTFVTNIPQSYRITVDGIDAFRMSRARSRHQRIPKRIFFEMLATKGSDKNYLRTRRALIIQYLKNWRIPQQIQDYLSRKRVNNIPIAVIQDDIKNFERIGLNVKQNGRNQFRIADSIINLRVPVLPVPELMPSYITRIKLRLSSQTRYINHSFFDLVDLGFDSKQNRLFELRIVELLNLIDDLIAIRLSGGNRPEIIAYSPHVAPINGVIMDSKSYRNGFNIPNSERDKMVRYINEYNQKNPSLNNNRWWENFRVPNYPQTPIKYTFVSGNFIGQFLSQIQYILTQTGINGGAITSEKLIGKVDAILDPNISYTINDFFNDLGCNGLVQ